MEVSIFLSIGTWPHWHQPAYKLAMRMRELGMPVRDIDHTRPDYLADLDVMIIEQNGFNDYVEVYQEGVQEFVRSGGICWILHQDHERWTPNWLPDELADAILVPRYYKIAKERWEYLLPEIRPLGRFLFRTPCRIDPEEMVYWEVRANGIHTYVKQDPELVRSAALSSIIHTRGWTILGGYRDSVIADGALIMEARYGKGLFFWTQLLFPEVKPPENDRPLAFWDKFSRNVLARFETFKQSGFCPEVKTSFVKDCAALPPKINYRMITHIHSLDWWGAGASPNTLKAAMRYLNMDIAIMSVNGAFSFGRPVLDNLDQYQGDGVLLIPGEEFHPFNWEPGSKVCNRLHILSMGTDKYTRKFRGGLFNEEEIDRYVKEALAVIKRNGGVACATHVTDDYWTRYDFEAVDLGERMLRGLAGTELEEAWIAGKKVVCTTCVDMWGIQRLREYPVFHFIYVDGVPTKESVLAAIRRGRLMPALRMEEAHVALGSCLPGDTLGIAETRFLQLAVSVRSQTPMDVVKIFSGKRVVFQEEIRGTVYKKNIEAPVSGLKSFIRLEIIGADCMLITNPFYLRS